MGKYAQFVMGSAGVGKSTYCSAISRHCESVKRVVHVVNLDPAAESFDYPVSIDIRELISLQDVMEELDLGPNGGLVYCMEYLLEHIDWLQDHLNDYDDDYLIFDCPGQIELYNHLPIMPLVIKHIQRLNYNCCVVYLLDSMFLTDASRFISGTLMCLSAMVSMEMPHVNVLSKCDQVHKYRDTLRKKGDMADEDDVDEGDEFLNRFLDPSIPDLLGQLNKETSTAFHRLNESISTLLEQYSLVSYLPLDLTKEESIGDVLANIDGAIQYGEDEEVKDNNKEEEEEEEMGAANDVVGEGGEMRRQLDRMMGESLYGDGD